MNVYTEPGKGRKECLNCHKYVGLRTLVCECGTEFPTKGLPQAEPMKEEQQLDPGLKQCPKCKESIDEECAACPKCHTLLDSDEPALVQSSKPRVFREPQRIGMQTVGIPAGPPPYKLTDLSPENILDWSDKTKQHFLDKNMNLLDQGVLYFARRMYDFNSDEFKTIRDVLKKQEFVPPVE